jgi:hypothetical protein
MDGLARGGDARGFGGAQHRAAADESAEPAREAGRDSGQRPQSDGQACGQVEADAVDQHAGDQRAGGVGNGKNAEHQTVLLGGEVELIAHGGRERSEGLPVQIVDGRRKHEHRKHQPTEALRGVGRWRALRLGQDRPPRA